MDFLNYDFLHVGVEPKTWITIDITTHSYNELVQISKKCSCVLILQNFIR